ncbi:MAG TPA: metallophosphoesterase [Anaerohalosphaeraceae bacterium]|jgi:predicted phosphodiesterase|nr:metallophosphoesterase [Anaerohalosphaeraceae bacterium]HRT50520.1 metallophosphoesterase [Anaerohalosphaeraceae bacterium]HRT86450.1 metallophosphoesterase [Anaerohalosphaeraceae bacterium]
MKAANGAHTHKAARRRLKPQHVFVFLAAGLFFAWEIHALVIAHRQRAAGLPDNYGNFDHVLRSIEKRPHEEPFSFAVVGDPHCSSTFVRMCARLRQEPLSFIVIVGDFSKRCRRPYHDFFQYQCNHTYGLSVPVLLVPGNRDVDYKHSYGSDISLDEFAAMYGPPNFAFEHGGCLFIGLCIFPLPASSEEGLNFLEATLAARRDKNKNVFVFLHPPAMFKAGIPAGYFQDCPRFVDIVKRYRVDYVIAGHHHVYNAVEWAGTNYLVTGGGGAPLKETQSFGGLHHAVVFTVSRGSISQRAVLVRRRYIPADGLARLSLVKLYPVLSRHPVDTAILNVAVLLLAAPAITAYLPKRRRTSHADAAVEEETDQLVAVTCGAEQEEESEVHV